MDEQRPNEWTLTGSEPPEWLIARAREAADELHRRGESTTPEAVAATMTVGTIHDWMAVHQWACEVAAAKALEDE